MQHDYGVRVDPDDPVDAHLGGATSVVPVAGTDVHPIPSGARLVLCTAEAAGPVAGEVGDRLAVQRRLALAVHGAPATPPEGWPVLRIGPPSAADTAEREPAPSSEVQRP